MLKLQNGVKLFYDENHIILRKEYVINTYQ